MRRTAPEVAFRTGELLPRLFTLVTPVARRLFSVTLLYPRGYLPVRKHGALRCPDFPSRFPGTMEQPAAVQRYKIDGTNKNITFGACILLRLPMTDINIGDFGYELPEDRIAQYPAPERDGSKLLLYDGYNITSDTFRNIGNHISKGSLLVFNDTRVIRARLVFHKKSGARIEIFCLEPIEPPGYETSFSSSGPVKWKCIIGNLKKWKSRAITMKFLSGGKEYSLEAEKAGEAGEARIIKFSWDCADLSFSEVIEAAGHIPLPPYIAREDVIEDNDRYQTVYSAVKGSVAAPTAGLHFTDGVLNSLPGKGIDKVCVTLHVGAGTFQPVRSGNIASHNMHTEHFFVTHDTISKLIENEGRIIAVGTTSVRTIESIYWLGIKAIEDPDINIENLKVGQWEPYNRNREISSAMALDALSEVMKKKGCKTLSASTQLIIIPGYRFRVTNGIITNFHQPGSTLLLLIAAWAGNAWKDIYNYALNNGFRFLSYGDSSFLFHRQE